MEMEVEAMLSRVERWGRGKRRTDELVSHLRCGGGRVVGMSEVESERIAALLHTCGLWLVLRDYPSFDRLASPDVRLAGAWFCKQEKLCPICAFVRSCRVAMRLADKMESLQAERGGRLAL